MTDPVSAGWLRRTLRRALLAGLTTMVVVALITGGYAYVRPGGGADDPAADPSKAGAEADRGSGVAANAPGSDEPDEPTPETATDAPTQPQASAPTGSSDSPGDGDAAPASQTSVQVLDGAGNPTAAEQAAQALRDLGYDVVFVTAAARAYAVTTVLATQGHEAEAEALLQRDERFVEAGTNTNLDSEVDLHVVVGADWPG